MCRKEGPGVGQKEVEPVFEPRGAEPRVEQGGWFRFRIGKHIWVGIHYDKLNSTITQEYIHSDKLKIKA